MLISGRRLALDYGDVRIGVSISDPTGIVVSPLTTIRNDGETGSAISEISRLIDENEIVVVYIGLPLHLSGIEGESSAKVRVFSGKLREKLSAKIEMRLVDERLSTAAAEREAREAGKNLTKQNVDQWAAIAILESALNKEKLSGELAGIPL